MQEPFSSDVPVLPFMSIKINCCPYCYVTYVKKYKGNKLFGDLSIQLSSGINDLMAGAAEGI